MRLVLGGIAGLLMLGLAGCSDDDGDTLTAEQQLAVACFPVCNAESCMACDTSGADPVCVSTCGPGLMCQDGQCIGAEDQNCDPACDACETCDTSGATPTCVSNCAANMECSNNRCVLPESCDSCQACEACDISGEAPVCVDACGDGTLCSGGVCIPDPALGCDPTCGACQICDTSSGEGVCLNLCDAGEYCDAGTCRRDTVHRGLRAIANATFTTPQEVTAKCVGCHDQADDHLKASAHWTWTGPTPDMEGFEGSNDQGKATVINNFCIAVASNWKRCTVCHAGYGWTDASYDFEDTSNMDCLVCHASPDSGYAKSFTTANGIAADVDLKLAAQSAGKTTRKSCGRCHFNAGGGDGVKKGDIGSELTNPSPTADVHMGRGFTCSDCHWGGDHLMLGQGVHNIVREGGSGADRLLCADCHTSSPHSDTTLDDHTDHIACQTCHVPHFSRQQPTKIYWDWSKAGDKGRGVETQVVGSREVEVYNWKKGEFTWQQNVRPDYAWHNGKVKRVTTTTQYTEGTGADTDPIVLAKPTGPRTDTSSRIWPFKVMRGKQAVDSDAARRKVLVPNLFGPSGFWANVPATYDAAAVEALWDTVLTTGARAAGQIGETDTYGDGGFAWGWLSTEMYMAINHEVAPASEALQCLDCHGEDTFFPWSDLGYDCNPMTDDGCRR
jgi:octaheme c-type cytochrome (tetrathionate reductase family)